MTWLSSARVSLTRSDSTEAQQLDIKKKQAEIKVLKLQLVLKCADVSHPTRPLALHLEWSSRIRDEFFAQGDIERAKELIISPLCDRTSATAASYPQGQLGFINYVSRPVFSLLAAVVLDADVEEMKPWLANLESNIKYWEAEAARLCVT
jgi:hypothetical protein